MTVHEFVDQIEFAASAMKNTARKNGVRALVTLKGGHVISLDIKQIGFNDKENIIYLEIE